MRIMARIASLAGAKKRLSSPCGLVLLPHLFFVVAAFLPLFHHLFPLTTLTLRKFEVVLMQEAASLF